ncbi:hypothetical protein QEM27_005233 [Pseudomonas putida]|nr:hypothetical protein [Pseudomonas putida]EKT8868629.1 hypothetical protein [Pseudomonas putida]
MKRIIAAAGAGALLLSAGVLASEYAVPQENWEFMRGYKYDYPGCSVRWHERTASFLVAGEGCEKISPQKMRADALKSIAYVKKNSSASDFDDYYDLVDQANKPYTIQDANRDAQQIWLSGCSDFKSGMNAGNFQGWLRLDDAEKAHPGIKKTAVTRLYMDGWRVAHGLGGVVNCNDLAPYRAADYVSGVDIRN